MHLHMCSEGPLDGMSHGAEQDHEVHSNQRGINQKVIRNDQKQCKMVFKCNMHNVFLVGVKFAVPFLGDRLSMVVAK